MRKQTVDSNHVELLRIAEVFPSAPPGRFSPPPAAVNHVFIVGLPRSGTTLLERILTGHRGVRSNGETDNFSRALLGAIHRALPQATLLHAHRNPLDSCFAMFRTLFGEAYPFSYDFQDLARYYAAYQRLMQHWRNLLGERLSDVSYEKLVRDPANTGARVASLCGMTWDPAAVGVEKNAAVSWTASAAQVCRPIYGTSSGRWRRYRSQLRPLIAALRAQGVAIEEDE